MSSFYSGEDTFVGSNFAVCLNMYNRFILALTENTVFKTEQIVAHCRNHLFSNYFRSVNKSLENIKKLFLILIRMLFLWLLVQESH